MTLLIIIIPILFLGIIGGVAYFFVTKSRIQSVEKEENAKTAQDFYPVEKITDGYIILKNNKKRRIIQCSSINYYLKTEEEQNQIEMIFQQFLNSLSFPISIFIQNRMIENSKRMKILKEEASLAKLRFPELEDYAERYIDAMSNINIILNNSYQKNKYIIVPYDEEVDAASATESEKDEYIKKELENRCSTIMNGLSNLGIKTNILKNDELLELFYSISNRENYIYSENITENEGLSNFVEGSVDVFKKNYKKNLRASIASLLNIYRVNSNSLTKEDREIEEILKDVYQSYGSEGEK